MAEAGVQAHHLSLARGRGGPGHGGLGLLGGGVQILAVVVTEWLRLGSLGRVPCLTTGHFAYFTFGRKIVLAFRAVRRVSNHFGIGNVSFWQRTKIQYGDQYYAVYVLCLVLRELLWKF